MRIGLFTWALLLLSDFANAQMFGFPDFSELTEQITTLNNTLNVHADAISDLSESINTLNGESVPDLLEGVTGLTEQVATTTEAFNNIANMYQPELAKLNDTASTVAGEITRFNNEAAAFNNNFSDLNKNLDNFYGLLTNHGELFKTTFVAGAGLAAGSIITGFVIKGVLDLITKTVNNMLTYEKRKGQEAVAITSQALESIYKMASFNGAFDELKNYITSASDQKKVQSFLDELAEQKNLFSAKIEDSSDPAVTKVFRTYIETLTKIEKYVTATMKLAQKAAPLLQVKINTFKSNYYKVIVALTLSFKTAIKYTGKQDDRLLKKVKNHVRQVFKDMEAVDDSDDENFFKKLAERFNKQHQKETNETLNYLAFQFDSMNKENEELIQQFLELVWTDLHEEALAYNKGVAPAEVQPNLWQRIAAAIKKFQQRFKPVEQLATAGTTETL